MLARVAQNLYWMGRYMERAEFQTRYAVVQYFSTLEAPMLDHADFTLRSILYMSGTDYDSKVELSDTEVIRKVIFDASDPTSVVSMVNNVRENARGIRNNISTELWESINKWNLYCKDYNRQTFSISKFYAFFEQMRGHVAMVKSDMVHTLLHRDVWHFLNIGVYLERAFQVMKIIRSKISDYTILSNDGENRVLLLYQYHILLKCLEAFDIHQVLTRGKLMNSTGIFELVIGNMDFPRSVNASLNKYSYHLKAISEQPTGHDQLCDALDLSLKGFWEFNQFDSEDMIIQHLEDVNQRVLKLHTQMDELFFQ
ncbi:MAG: alpha-E domain-containing protein [Bacteroidia bacterium]|nr:alpha-E domain-containing protein [Bacteroidia bacterium]